MAPSRLTIVAALLGCTLVAGCKKKDSELRWYVRSELGPFLDSLAYQICQVKVKAAPNAPGVNICIGPPDGYKKPPSDGSP
jgi:hypothetical protein